MELCSKLQKKITTKPKESKNWKIISQWWRLIKISRLNYFLYNFSGEFAWHYASDQTLSSTPKKRTGILGVKSSFLGLVRLSVCTSVLPSICPSVHLSVCQSIRLSVYPSFFWILKLFDVKTSTGKSIPIPHSEPFLHLRCGNGSKTYLNLYVCIQLATLSNYI